MEELQFRHVLLKCKVQNKANKGLKLVCSFKSYNLHFFKRPTKVYWQ